MPIDNLSTDGRSGWPMSGRIAGVMILLVIVLASGGLAWQFRHDLATWAWRFRLPETNPAARDAIRFAVIGDYGSGSLPARQVGVMIESWSPDLIVTVGDNNYPRGADSTIDRNVGQIFHSYIFPYAGRFGSGASVNRFFPIPGHRDWDSDSLRPYLDYFQLPGNERYYDVVRGPVHLFMLDTDEREPDGATEGSKQAAWLQTGLRDSESSWNIVLAHHAPYTSHTVEDVERMRWPFKEWGADAVLSGFYHVYERLEVEGIPYFVVGNGGSFVSDFGEIDGRSRFRYNDDYGALIVDATSDLLTFRLVDRKGGIMDHLALRRPSHQPNP